LKFFRRAIPKLPCPEQEWKNGPKWKNGPLGPCWLSRNESSSRRPSTERAFFSARVVGLRDLALRLLHPNMSGRNPKRIPIKKNLYRTRLARICLVFLILATLALAAGAAMPSWIQNIEVRTLLESAIFRAVPLPGGPVTIRRPPLETVPAITELIKSQPHPEEL
jgi:hypothetical protein